MTSTSWPLYKISELHDSNDVLLSHFSLENISILHSISSQQQVSLSKSKTALDDGSFTSIEGNSRFLDSLRSRQEEYASKNRLEKPLVAVELLKSWRNQKPPGRFLEVEEGTNPPLFQDVGDKKARAFISKALKTVHKLGEEEKKSMHNVDRLNNISTSPSANSHPNSLMHQASANTKFARTNKLYEREEQRSMLLEAYSRRINPDTMQKPELVLITGASGEGKTELALSVREEVEGLGALCICGKFDQFRTQAKPYAAFIDAMQQLALRIQHKHDSTLEQKIKNSMQEALGPEAQHLLDAMPCLIGLLDVEESSSSSEDESMDGLDAKSARNLPILFRRFMQAILQHMPLMLILDDLQWADQSSLGLLYVMLTPEFEFGKGMLIVGTVRGNEVSMHDYLSEFLRGLEADGVLISTIQVAPLSLSALRKLIKDAGIDNDQCDALAKVVQSSTEGNALHSVHYLHRLIGEGTWKIALQNNYTTEITPSDSTDGIASMLTTRMQQLPQEVQEVLKVASCLGNEFHEPLLCHAGTVTSSTVLEALSVAEELGLIVYDFGLGVGKFTHDKFQEAAFALVGEDKDRFQLQIGRALYRQLPERQLRSYLLLVVNLMVQGRSQIERDDEREKLAKLCLTAARKAAKASAFCSAIQYVESGISLLERRHWRDQYSLSLLLYSTGAELAYCNGNHGMVDHLTREIFDNARCDQDKLQAWQALILSWDARGEYGSALGLCLDILNKQGVHLPRKNSGTPRIAISFFLTRRMLQGKTFDSILNLPPMRDSKALIAMSIIHLLYPMAVIHDKNLAPLSVLHLVSLTLKHGFSSLSGIGFAFYGIALVRLGYTEAGCKYGQLALMIMEKHPVKELKGRTIGPVWAHIQPEVEPLRICLTHLFTAHHLSLRTGDLSNSGYSLLGNTLFRFLVGEPLQCIVERLLVCLEFGRNYNHIAVYYFVLPLLQSCYILMGRPELANGAQKELDAQPVTFNKQVPEGASDEFKTKTLESATAEFKKMIKEMWEPCMEFFTAVYLNDLNHAKDSVFPKLRKVDLRDITPSLQRHQFFLDGFLSASFSGKSRFSRWRAERKVKQLQKAALLCPENHLNKVYVIQAELEASSGRYDEAGIKFEKAIRYSAQYMYPQEQGLACERAARMYLSCGKYSEAANYFSEALRLYDQWGATAKTSQLREELQRIGDLLTLKEKLVY